MLEPGSQIFFDERERDGTVYTLHPALVEADLALEPLEASGPPALGPTPAEVGEPAQLVAVPLMLPPLVHEAVAAPEAPGQQEPAGRGAAA